MQARRVQILSEKCTEYFALPNFTVVGGGWRSCMDILPATKPPSA
jgi:hypothetical protein